MLDFFKGLSKNSSKDSDRIDTQLITFSRSQNILDDIRFLEKHLSLGSRVEWIRYIW